MFLWENIELYCYPFLSGALLTLIRFSFCLSWTGKEQFTIALIHFLLFSHYGSHILMCFNTGTPKTIFHLRQMEP